MNQLLAIVLLLVIVLFNRIRIAIELIKEEEDSGDDDDSTPDTEFDR